MGNALELFATTSDLIESLSPVEQVQPVQYCAISSNEPTAAPVESIAALASKIDEARESHWLVTRAGVTLHARRVTTREGNVWYSFDQSQNPDSVLLYTGARQGKVLTPGRISTGSAGPEAQSLFRLFRKWYKKRSQRVRSYWVGAEALVMLRSGYRLTCNETASPIYDLREE